MHTRISAALLCTVVLSACGGSGSSGDLANYTAENAVNSVDIPGDQNTDRPQEDAGGQITVATALRIVLTWNKQPQDLDAHLTGPERDGAERFHVYSGNRNADTTSLVIDATAGSGPETIEIKQQRTGVYRYSVFNFSGDIDQALNQSGAHVEVFAGTASMAQYTVPAGAGNLWTVFDIDNGQIVAVNKIGQLQNVLDYFSP